tara:strand:- start:165 stop:398 length:234 start_codon:yes stop_codon:yes gene_type:complete
MKKGDIVRQHGKTMKGAGTSENLGVVISVQEIPSHAPENVRRNMASITGRMITVMWESGRIDENFAEKMLEVVVESD